MLSSRLAATSWLCRVLRSLARLVAVHEMWVVSPVVLALLLSSRALLPALCIEALVWSCRRVACGHLSRPSANDVSIGLLLLMAGVSASVTAWPGLTAASARYLLAGLITYSAAINWADSANRLRLLAFGLLGAGAGLALLTPFGITWSTGSRFALIPPSVYRRLPSIIADAANPNVMAGALALVLPLAWGIVVSPPPRHPGIFPFARPVRRWLAIGALLVALLILGALGLTQSRAALVGGLLGGGFVLLFRWPRSVGLLGGVLAAVAAFWLQRTGLRNALDVVLSSQALGGLDGRLEIWSRALYMIQDFPFTGVGMGSFLPVAKLLYPFFLFGPDVVIPHAHNLFLQVGVDLGLPGLIAYVAILLSTLWMLIRGLKDPEWRWLAAGLLGSLMAMCLHGLLDAATWGTKPAFLTWMLFGIAAALHNLRATSPTEVVHELDSSPPKVV